MKPASDPTLTAEDRANPVLRALASAYRDSRAGTTSTANRPFSIRYEKLVHNRAKADVGDERRARVLLARLEEAEIVRFSRKPLVREKILSVFIEPAAADRFFAVLGEPPPALTRQQAASRILAHKEALDAHPQAAKWKHVLGEAAAALVRGDSPEGLPRGADAREDVLRATVAVLNNRQPISLRRLSAQTLGDSKLLERRRDAVERFLGEFLSPDLATLESWSVADAPPGIRVHGPLTLELPEGRWSGDILRGSYTIAEEDLQRASSVFTPAPRCISIENLAVFREVASFQSGNFLVHTSYPGRAVTRLLSMLSPSVALYHWGDTDPWGYDILRVLRQKTGRAIQALNMRYRAGAGPSLSTRETALVNRLIGDCGLTDIEPELQTMRVAEKKGDYEQESLPLSNRYFPFVD